MAKIQLLHLIICNRQLIIAKFSNYFHEKVMILAVFFDDEFLAGVKLSWIYGF